VLDLFGGRNRAARGFACGLVACLAVPSIATHSSAQEVRGAGSVILTGGDLDFSDRRPQVPPSGSRGGRAVTSTDIDLWRSSWLHWIINGDEPRRRTPARAHVAPQRPMAAPDAAPAKSAQAATAATPNVPSVAAANAQPQPAPGAPQTPPAPMTTASITPAPGPARSAVLSPEANAALVRAADRTQARVDIVKLELAQRTYDEQRFSGRSAFDFRNDWRVLERARDALPPGQLAAAEAVGFEANAYINDAERTIVIAIAARRDLRRDFMAADAWREAVATERPQLMNLARAYSRSVMQRYQMQGYTTECVGHSLGGGACVALAGELGLKAIVLNPLSLVAPPPRAAELVTNYIVDGELAALVPDAPVNRAAPLPRVSDEVRARIAATYGELSGPVLVVRDIQQGARVHRVDRALDLLAVHAEAERAR
jgi:hypothetical protein